MIADDEDDFVLSDLGELPFAPTGVGAGALLGSTMSRGRSTLSTCRKESKKYPDECGINGAGCHAYLAATIGGDVKLKPFGVVTGLSLNRANENGESFGFSEYLDNVYGGSFGAPLGETGTNGTVLSPGAGAVAGGESGGDCGNNGGAGGDDNGAWSGERSCAEMVVME
ncbi:hypothetical protein RIF29_40402 [Crotalaria pallida]|uniref:Uncharacterized protein n=1 Tax=Crotalaria pallida TaxID=3830 RepID=A0AAN9E3L9_CROPI